MLISILKLHIYILMSTNLNIFVSIAIYTSVMSLVRKNFFYKVIIKEENFKYKNRRNNCSTRKQRYTSYLIFVLCILKQWRTIHMITLIYMIYEFTKHLNPDNTTSNHL